MLDVLAEANVVRKKLVRDVQTYPLVFQHQLMNQQIYEKR